ncbi:MAG: alpha/beta hydrolase [Gammaproteobacteria bacterium]|nr:alpha/beta hydrolase [Gammaproteobacteria bacterium]MBU1732005.1 alpha/beta hydrolase [Gammaproteobacteria bacterium]MBU1894046.1 alpha/beta hydrolase [Gammaproteobacteria bacterium]
MQGLQRVQDFLVLLVFLAAPVVASADTVEIRFSPGLVGVADYRAGKAELPAVLLLHGFLQTRNSPPMSRLADALSDAGYPVLVPTLTLGVSRRNKSLSCEAVHKHTLPDDLQEVSQWLNWLANHGYKKVVMIGHSSGSKDVLAYLVDKPGVLVERAILVGITPIEVDAEQHRKARAEKPAMSGQMPPLGRFTVAYCKNNYVATVPAYLSYADWTGDVIANALGKIKVPVDVVLGTKDQVISPTWRGQLEKSRVPLTLIENAGHFFDGEHEFELNDRVLEILKKKHR